MSDIDESEIQHVFAIVDGEEPTQALCGTPGTHKPLTDKPFCAVCHIAFMRLAIEQGFRVTGEINLDEAHAVAAEREAICKLIENSSDFALAYNVRWDLANAIRSGAHNTASEGVGNRD